MTLILLIAVVFAFVCLWIRISETQAANRSAVRRLARTMGLDMYTEYDGTVNFYSDSYTSSPARVGDLNRLQEQFSLFLKDSGYKFVPQKTEEVHQGDKHEVKVTPAKFVKSRK
jgi:hypothetical protein